MIRLFVAVGLMGAVILSGKNDQEDYRKQIRAWQVHREAGLRSPTGWLTLAGLFWLKEGKSTIGSGETSDYMLPKDAPSQVGEFNVAGSKVLFRNLDGSNLALNGQPMSGTVVLKHDEDEDKCDKVGLGPVQFYVMDRLGKLAIRVKDADSETLKSFTGTKFFPIDPALRFEAKFTADSQKIEVPDVLGKVEMQESPGVVEFNYRGHAYKMRPVYEGKTLFFIFKDLTSKKETYQAGRMVNTPLPENGKVILDFNRAYNPPCIFTPYATCPLPPKQNILPIRIEAGELRYGKDEVPQPQPAQ